jgi:hypothetical protein
MIERNRNPKSPTHPTARLTYAGVFGRPEAIAYLLTDRLNLGSVKYLAGYSSEEEPLPNYSPDAVLQSGRQDRRDAARDVSSQASEVAVALRRLFRAHLL